MKGRTLSVLALSILVILGSLYWYAVSSKYLVSSEKANELIRNKQIDVVLDVRTSLERKTLGLYPGSVHIPGADLETKVPATYPERATRFLVYCNTGQRARAAADTLHRLGYTNTVYIASSHRSLLE